MDPTPHLGPRTPRRDRMISLAVTVVLLMLACGILAGTLLQRTAPSSRPEDDIRAVLAAQKDAWNRGDLEGYMAGYWHSDELTFCSGGDVTKGWQPTLDRYRKRYQTGDAEMGRLTFDELSVKVLTADAALVRGRWAVARRKDAPHGLFTLEMTRFPEGWKVVYDHTSAADK